MGNDGADALAVAGCSFPEEPERDWVRLKRLYIAGKDSMVGIPVAISTLSGVLTHETQGTVLSPPSAGFASSSSAGTTYSPSKPPVVSTLKQSSQSTSRTTTIPALGPPVQIPKIAAPKNTMVDIVYSDGACRANGTANAVGGIGVWWGPNDPRCGLSLPPHPCEADLVCLSEISPRDAPVRRRITGQS